jgi:tetratricopeptide (TPR) repeat protein
MLGEGMEFGGKMNRYLKLLHDGTDPKEGFLKIFGEPKNITKVLSRYTRQRTLPAVMIPTPPRIDVSKFVVTRLTGAQMSAELGGYYMRQRRLEDARDKLKDALKEDPKNWLAHENLAFVNYAEGKESEALMEWDAALALNPKAVLSLYYRNLVELRTKKDADSIAKLKTVMDKVLEIAPEMTVAEMLRSRLFAMQGDVESSLASAKRVLKLEPDLAGFFLNYAEIELLRKNYAGAINTAKWVAVRWSGADRAEALELTERARRAGGVSPTDEAKSEEAALLDYAKETVSVLGTIESVTCQKDSHVLTVQSGEKKYTLRGSRSWYGWSDTLGLAREHFNPCYHARGMRVVVRAKSAPVENEITEMTGFELRNDLLPGHVE